MNILMLTLMYPLDQLDEVTANARDKLQNQINNYQHAFANGIRLNLMPNENLHVLNCLPVGVFPVQYRQLLLKSGVHDGGRIQQIGCINLPFFKQKSRAFLAERAIEQWVRADRNNRTVLVYTQYLPYMTALSKLKKKYPELKVAVIITDLPNEMGLSTGRRGIFKKAESLIGKLSIEALREMDGYILLTEPMAEALQIQNKPYEVIEGLILSDIENSTEPFEEHTKPVFLYSGTLEKDLGISELLSAFEQMPEYMLWICGHGNMSNEVKEYEKRCSNIRFWGFVPQKKALALQANATALLNPRQASGAFTRYSFPSKTLEYMRSGKPVLCCKLEGIPNDYDPYLQYMDVGTDGVVKAVKNLMALTEDERKQIGESARKYVLEHKNPYIQCKKLLCLLRRL